MADTKEVLSFAVELGDNLLRNGAEVYRVEDSVLAILNSYSITDCDVYVISNGIFASANETTDDSCSIIRHVPLQPTNLSRISALNNLCRRVCNGQITIDEAWDDLNKCSHISTYNNRLLLAATGVGSACFSYMFGGSVLDAVLSFFIGCLLFAFIHVLARVNSSKAVTNVLGSALVTLCAIGAALTGLPVHYDKIIIGDIMYLVPGIALTTSIRDFVNGDYLAGTIKFIDALLTAFCIAVGVGIIITLVHIITGGVWL